MPGRQPREGQIANRGQEDMERLTRTQLKPLNYCPNTWLSFPEIGSAGPMIRAFSTS